MPTRYSTRRRVVQFAGSAVALGLAGCATSGSPSEPAKTTEGHDGSHDGGSSHDAHTDASHQGDLSGEPVEHADVRLVATDGEFHFDPHVVHLEVGGTVEWTLESGSHTTTAYHPDNDKPLRMPDGATPWDSGIMSETGATFEHTFETAGVYDYLCVPHEAMGMISSVLVGEPDPHEQPGLEAPQASLPEPAKQKIEGLNARVNEALGHTH